MYIPIPEYKNYSIDETGNLINNKFGRPLKSYINDDGYLCVQLWKNNKGKNFLVHQLVGQLFVPNPNNFKIVNHKDGNRMNPHYLNLEWSTNEANIKHGIELRNNTKMSKKKIIKLYKSQTWKSVDDFVKQLIAT